MKKKIFLFIGIFILCLQLVRPNANNGRAEARTDILHCLNVPDKIQSILKRSCYDCHSNHTAYPWYSSITPLNFWLSSHVGQGKKVFNCSDFSMYSQAQLFNLLRRIQQATRERRVPLPSYLFIHKEAALSDEEIKQIVAWTRAEMERLAPSAGAFSK